MRAAELRKMDSFFGALTSLQRFMVTRTAEADEAGDCDCEVTPAGVYKLRGRCAASWVQRTPSTQRSPLPDHCRTVVHLAARIQLGELKLPHEHLSDPQLDVVVGQMAALVDQAPGLTERQFVVRLQEVLRASLADLAIPSEPTEENPTP